MLNAVIGNGMCWREVIFPQCGELIYTVAALQWFPLVDRKKMKRKRRKTYSGKGWAIEFVYPLTPANAVNQTPKHVLKRTAHSLFPTSHPRALYIVHTMEIQNTQERFFHANVKSIQENRKYRAVSSFPLHPKTTHASVKYPNCQPSKLLPLNQVA